MRLALQKFEWITRKNSTRRERLRSAGRVMGDVIIIPDEAWEVKDSDPPRKGLESEAVKTAPIGNCNQQSKAMPAEPSMKNMAVNLVSALGAWAAAGFPVLSAEDARARGEQCSGSETKPKCAHWQPDARAGFGKCRLCGCTNLKWWLATAKCPIQKWEK